MTVRLAVVGSLNMDLVVTAPHIPGPGETVIGDRFETAAGGKGANQAVAAARLGARVAMVGRIGLDAYGEAQLRGLAAEGIDTTGVRVDPDTHTGVALIVVEPSGQNSIVVSPGANWRLSAEDVEAAAPSIVAADMLLLQQEVRPEVVERAMAIARGRGVAVLLNPAPARPIGPELLQQVDYLIANEDETARLTGREVTDGASAGAAAAELRWAGIRAIVITLGGRGAYLKTERLDQHISAFPVQVVDTTAAGDAFVGAFAFMVACGQSLAEAVLFANAAGALAATQPGAQPSLPHLSAVRSLVESIEGLPAPGEA